MLKLKGTVRSLHTFLVYLFCGSAHFVFQFLECVPSAIQTYNLLKDRNSCLVHLSISLKCLAPCLACHVFSKHQRFVKRMNEIHPFVQRLRKLIHSKYLYNSKIILLIPGKTKSGSLLLRLPSQWFLHDILLPSLLKMSMEFLQVSVICHLPSAKLLLTPCGSIGNIPTVGTSTKKKHKAQKEGRVTCSLLAFLPRMGCVFSSDKTKFKPKQWKAVKS